MIILVLDQKVSWSKNLGTFFWKISMNRFFESPNSFASLLFYIFIIGSLDGCWDGGMSKYETLKNFEDPLIEPRLTIPYHTSHTTLSYIITFTTPCNRHHTMPYSSQTTISYIITFTTPQKKHTMKYLVIDTSPYNLMHATQHIKYSVCFWTHCVFA